MSETTHLRRGPRSPVGAGKAHHRRLWARRATQVAALAGFLAVFVATRQRLEGPPPNDPFVLLDPLLGATAMLATRQILPGLLWGLALIGLALVTGRLWCGWLCPLGTILDAVGGPKVRPTGQHLRQLKYLLLTAILAGALLGNLTLVALDPLTILTRSLAAAVWPALNWAFTGAESLLYRVPLLRAPVTSLDSLVRGGLLPYAQPPAPAALLFGGLFLGILALNAIAPRLWCRALCPLGAGLGLLSRLAPMRRRVSENCISCGRCARICPTQTIDHERGFASDPAECTLCMHCFVACPVDAQRLSGPWCPAPHQPYDPTRRQVLLAGGLGLAAAALGRVTVDAAHPEAYRLLPPGAHDPEFSSRCLRCGRCLRACPTGALQPSLWQADWQRFWSPVMTPRVGYCEHTCNTCGQVCPTGAIPRLDLAAKQKQIIGTAYIDRSRCIPWADARDCLCCQEVCPRPQKAIVLEEVEVWRDGATVTVRRPHVVRERCTGCGICENKCPLDSEAAIRVRVDDPTVRSGG